MGGQREYLIHLLTEAAEIEHNLLCSYLYAAFSLKLEGEGVDAHEGEAISGWRKTIVGVGLEEMVHLALVNNLLVSIGGAAHFDRPNLPVAPGYHPAGFVVRLMPLTKATLDHFIFFERPVDAPVAEGGAYQRREPLERTPTPGDLTPSTPNYETIGEFYAEIRETVLALASELGAAAFLDTAHRQLAGPMTALPGLVAIRGLPDALRALDTIVEQGEGSTSETKDCHFTRFREMREEWSALEVRNQDFAPAHPAAHDPVMRRPSDKVERVWVTNPPAAQLLDLGNALYGHTLVLLQQAYAVEGSLERRADATAAAMTLMRALAGIGRALARIPATEGRDGNAGLSFAVPRNLWAAPPETAARLSLERLGELRSGARLLGLEGVQRAIEDAVLQLSERPSRPNGAPGHP